MSVHARLRKIDQNAGHFPTTMAATKCLAGAAKHTRSWTMPGNRGGSHVAFAGSTAALRCATRQEDRGWALRRHGSTERPTRLETAQTRFPQATRIIKWYERKRNKTSPSHTKLRTVAANRTPSQLRFLRVLVVRTRWPRFSFLRGTVTPESRVLSAEELCRAHIQDSRRHARKRQNRRLTTKVRPLTSSDCGALTTTERQPEARRRRSQPPSAGLTGWRQLQRRLFRGPSGT